MIKAIVIPLHSAAVRTTRRAQWFLMSFPMLCTLSHDCAVCDAQYELRYCHRLDVLSCMVIYLMNGSLASEGKSCACSLGFVRPRSVGT